MLILNKVRVVLFTRKHGVKIFVELAKIYSYSYPKSDWSIDILTLDNQGQKDWTLTFFTKKEKSIEFIVSFFKALSTLQCKILSNIYHLYNVFSHCSTLIISYS